VGDTGIGIPADKQDRLFAKFSQVDASVTRAYGGTGLGLAISKQLTELMGGTMGVQSETGKGSEFWFTVHLAKSPASETPPLSLPVNLQGKRVLIVDNTPVNREVFMGLLKSWGLCPDEAADSGTALKMLTEAKRNQRAYALAILDMQLPGTDGITLGRIIKSNPNLQETQLMLCFSFGQPGNNQKWEEAGFVAAVTKPVRQRELRDVLEASLSGRKPASTPTGSTSNFALESGLSHARVLVAEDNITNQQITLGILKKLGLHAEVVANGLEALQSLKLIPYDLVLMDVQMPEMNGITATQKIRDPQSGVLNSQVPIIAMTAHALSGDRDHCLEAGMDDYITKPVELSSLVAAMKKWLQPNSAKSKPLGEEEEETGTSGARDNIDAIFDRSDLMDRVMQDEELARLVINAFLGDMPKQIELLKQSAAAGEFENVEKLAHQIKGASATVGGAAFSRLAGIIEQAGRAGNMAVIAARVEAVDAHFASFQQAINNEIQPLPTSAITNLT
jgi:CheY-like chemotaxis protein/HPt (histidine-containing phosphotransfer) domain-containing protein